MSTDIASQIEVSVLSFTELFEASMMPVAVDTYQRGFVWNDDKIRQLAVDLVEFQKLPSPRPPYYMGSVLLHRNAEKGKRFIIDGQQRLTALCVLHQQLRHNLPGNCALTYSPKSALRIRDAAKVLGEHSLLPDPGIFDQVVFTLICVNAVDMAFTFFDTQNNRGVPLHATDLLKAFHLRAVDGPSNQSKEALQTICAQRWEGVQQGESVMSHDREFVSSLFAKFLWRARCWTGRRVVYGDHDALLEEFQKQTLAAEGDYDTVPLYRSRHNRLGTALTLRRDGHGEIHTNRISLSSKAEDLPFAIRQPIQQGIGFFLYSDKYAALLRRLVVLPSDSIEIRCFREVYEKLLMANSVFLREAFLLASLMFSDQFDDQRLWEFSLWLEHAFGAIRLEKQQVRYEAAQNFFRDEALNLLDVIAGSFRPEQAISYLQKRDAQLAIYAIETVESGKGVQGIYKKAVQDYYGKSEQVSLSAKKQWIADKLKTVSHED